MNSLSKAFISKVQIIEANDDAKMRAFIRFPFSLYKDNPYWAPPLDMEEKKILSSQNPSLEFCELQCILAYKEGKVVGRMAVFINKNYNATHNAKMGRFGWIDFIDDREVSAALFDYATAWLAQRGMTEIHGPLGFTDLDYEGMLVDGFEELGTMATIYNYPYYKDHVESYGFTQAAEWNEGRVFPRLENWGAPKMFAIADAVKKRYNVSLASIKNKKDLLHYADDVFELINLCYKDLYGFTPLTPSQIQFYINNYLSLAVREYIPIVVDKNNKAIGFMIVFPSFTKVLQKIKGKLFPFGFIRMLYTMKKHDVADLYLVAVHPDYRNKGIIALMYTRFSEVAGRRKLKYLETNILLSSNEEIMNMNRNVRNDLYQVNFIKRRVSYYKKIA